MIENKIKNRLKRRTIILTAAICLAACCFITGADTAKAKVTNEYMDYAKNYAGLKWAVKLGTGWANNPTQPAVHGSYIYVATKSSVMKISKKTGKILKKVSIPSGQTFNIIPITYVEKAQQGSYTRSDGTSGDLLLVPMAENKVRGLDAATLETLFTTSVDTGREMSSGYQITTDLVCDGDGYYYFGTWYGDEQKGYYYCYKIGKTKPVWRVEHKGGFYLANAYVSDEYVYFASENGLRSQTGGTKTPLYTCMKGAGYTTKKPATPVVDTDPIMKGNSRGAVVSDGESLYTATQAGYAYKFVISTDESTKGQPTLDKSTPLKTDGEGNYQQTATTGEATIYKEVIYYCCSDGTINSYRTTDLEKISSINGFGYTQNGVEISTVRESQEGMYIYGSYNAKPGGIFAAKATTNGKLSGMIKLFTPPKDLRQYNMTSIVMDKGMIYYRNDSGYLMALEPGYTLWTQAGKGGAVTKGLAAEKGSSYTFYITAKKGYKRAKVTVDGKSMGAISKYTFKNVTAPHELKALFIQIPAKTTVKATALKGKKIRIKWKKASGATGYKIYRAVKKNGKYKLVKTIKKASVVKWTNKKLKAGKEYYYKVCAFRKQYGKTAYGAFSNKSYCKAKK